MKPVDSKVALDPSPSFAASTEARPSCTARLVNVWKAVVDFAYHAGKSADSIEKLWKFSTLTAPQIAKWLLIFLKTFDP